MINLGYGSGIIFHRISPDLVSMSIRLQTESDHARGLRNPYYNASTTEIQILLNQELYEQMRKEINELDAALILNLPENDVDKGDGGGV